MSAKRLSLAFISRSLSVAAGAVLSIYAGSAAALDFDVFGTEVKVDTLFSIGGTWRMQTIDDSLVSKSELYARQHPGGLGLCQTRDNNGDGIADSDAPAPKGQNTFIAGAIPSNCSYSVAAANEAYVKMPGSFSSGGDDGNIQFEKGDLVHGVAKLSSDISFSAYDFNVFIRPVVFFDQVYNDHELHFADTTLIPPVVVYTDAQKDMNAFTGIDILDANIGRTFEVFDRSVGIKLGKQVLNWGESSLLLFNSLNSINPPDARRLRLPGLDLKEILQPVGMLTINTDVIENVGLETFYQYEWRGVVFDPVGAFQSPADIFGQGHGRKYAMLGFGKAPEDPDKLWQATDTCEGPVCVDSSGLLGSHSSRTAYVTDTEPKNGGQYGFAVRSFLEGFNNGTELTFYFANYHSRVPVVSVIATEATCIGKSAISGPLYAQTAALNFATDCEYMGPGSPAGQEPVPVDTLQIQIEYPENIQMYGVSFNTTLGDWALSGEYAFRPKLPVQIHLTDLVFAGLNPALPEQDVPLQATTIPGRHSSFPTFLTAYRGMDCVNNPGCIKAGQYIRGYEEMKSGQLGITVLKLIGGDNPLGASQITFLLETGLTHTLDFPELSELQFNGGGTNTHISGGADGTQGIDPPAVAGNTRANTLRQNPTAHRDLDGFGSKYAWGYRNINLIRWDSALFGANLQALAIIRHDVKGTSPGIGTNFTQGRKEFNLGLSFDYLSSYIGEVRYTWFTGGANRDGSRDKDNIFVTLGYQF